MDDPKVETEIEAKIWDLIHQLQYEFWKLVFYNIEYKESILQNIIGGLDWIKKELPEDVEDIVLKHRLRQAELKKAKPKLNRRPKPKAPLLDFEKYSKKKHKEAMKRIMDKYGG